MLHLYTSCPSLASTIRLRSGGKAPEQMEEEEVKSTHNNNIIRITMYMTSYLNFVSANIICALYIYRAIHFVDPLPFSQSYVLCQNCRNVRANNCHLKVYTSQHCTRSTTVIYHTKLMSVPYQ